MTEKVLTVKEYAVLNGISTTAVYKQIKNQSLKTFEMVINGKKVKCIKVIEENQTGDIEPKFENVSNSSKTISNHAEWVELAEIIKEKDEIIKSKDVEICRLQKKIEELTERTLDSNSKLTELLNQSQILLKNSQILLNNGATAIEETTETQRVRKKHFWNRKKD